MKKIILAILVVMIPCLTIAQKRTKKNKKTTEEVSTDKTLKSSSAQFMIIKGVQIHTGNHQNINKTDVQPGDEASVEHMKSILKTNDPIIVVFDYGDAKVHQDIMTASGKFSSMTDAVNRAYKYNWEFINANVVRHENITTYYYYMRKIRTR